MKKIVILILFVFISSYGYAVVSDIGFDPLDQSSGSRPLGMGGAYTAISNDINCIFYNPAGLANSKGFTGTLRSTNNFSIGFGSPTELGNFGIGLVNKSYEDFENRDARSTYQHSLALVAFGFKIDQLLLGVNIKTLLSQRLTTKGGADLASNIGNGLDAGVIWSPLDYASFGLVLRNSLSQPYTLGASDEVIPRSYRIGMAVNILGSDALIYNEAYNLKFAYDLEMGETGEENKQNSFYGLEWALDNWFFIRFGGSSIFKVDANVSGTSFGAGYRFQDSELDFASVNDPITEASAFYFSFVYSPSGVFIFPEAEEIMPSEQQIQPEQPPAAPAPRELLAVHFPTDDLTTYDETVTIEGSANPEAIVSVNGVNVFIQNGGSFKALQSLNQGKNLIEISAILKDNKKTLLRKVFRKARVVIAEEEGLNKKIVNEVLNKEEEIIKKEDAIKKEKQKGLDVTAKEMMLVEEKKKYNDKKTELYSEKKRIAERKEKVENLVTLGVVEVQPNKTFEIEAPIKRGEMLTWLVKAAGLPIPKVEGPIMSDVPEDNEYAPFIKAAIDYNIIVKPADNRFRPNDPVTEQEGQEFFKAFGIVK